MDTSKSDETKTVAAKLERVFPQLVYVMSTMNGAACQSPHYRIAEVHALYV